MGVELPSGSFIPMRKIPLVTGEYYHIYNRGVDKRNIFSNKEDMLRFLQSMDQFNNVEPIGSIYENSFLKKDNNDSGLGSSTPKLKLVEFACYCVNPNHYHFILKQLVDDGIKNFMHRIGTGYTNYFNNKEKRNGALFQGRFKSIHINSNEYLLHLSAYVNLNDKVHKLGSSTPKLESQSSWKEYTWPESSTSNDFIKCDKDIILKQFRTVKNYKDFAESSLKNIIARKLKTRELESLFLE